MYCRKSSEAEDRQVLSIESQIQELERFAAGHNLPIGKTFTEAKSAKAPGRPIFSQMMEEVNRGLFAGILCWKLDRLARNPVDGGSLIWAIKQHGIKILTPQQSFSQNDDNAILMYVEFGIAQKFIDDLSRNVKRGLKAKAEQGWQPGMAPLGYLNEYRHGKGFCTIVKDPVRFPLIRRMWDLFLTGAYSVRDLHRLMNTKWGFRTRRNKTEREGPIALSAIYNILTAPFYCGEFEYPRRSGSWYRGAHEPMVTKEEFLRAQDILGRLGRPRPQRHQFAFTGMIRCGTCGAMVTAEEKWKHQMNGNVHHYTYYHCTKRKDPSCPERSMEEKALVALLRPYLAKIDLRPALRDWTFRHLDAMRMRAERDAGTIEHSRNQAMAQIQQGMDELIRMRYRGLIEIDEYERERMALKRQLADLSAQSVSNADDRWFHEATHVFEFSTDILNRFDTGDFQIRRTIMETVGSNLTLTAGILHLELKKPFKVLYDWPRPQSANFGRLEPQENGSVPRRNGHSAALRSSWLRVVEDVRTAIERESGVEQRNFVLKLY